MKKVSPLLLIFVLAGLSSACISNQTHKAVLLREATMQDSLSNRVAFLNQQLDNARLEIARSQGANEALLLTQDKLQDRLDLLQQEIDRLEATSTASQQDFGAQLRAKDDIIKGLQNRLQTISGAFANRDSLLVKLQGLLQSSLNDLDSTQYQMRIQTGRLVLSVQEDVLFRSGSTGKFSSRAPQLLNAVAVHMLANPTLQLAVAAHTDNQRSNREGLDNLQFSALRAANLVRYLSDQAGVSPNRLPATGLGESRPIQSNETTEGRKANRRLEFSFSLAEGVLERDVKKAL